MLKNLTIKNYALIDKIELNFNPGLTIITGETGAGKSILIGAIGLLTGNRTDTSILKNKQEKCVIEGSFQVDKYDLKPLFEHYDLDYEPITVIRREITPSGRSRAFINDTPVNLSVLKHITGFLIDIHSQHDTLLLNNPNYQLDVLDAFANNQQLLRQYKQQYSKLLELQKQLQQLTEKARKEKSDADYYQFQLDQLTQANLKPNEQQELEDEQRQLAHIEEIKNNLALIGSLLSTDETGIIAQLQSALKAASSITDFFPKANEFANRLESALIDLQDLSTEVETAFSDIDYDPERLETVNQRLDLIYQLEHKFNVDTIEQLLAIQKDLEQKLQQINDYDLVIQQLQDQVNKQTKIVNELAKKLSEKRAANKLQFEKEIMTLLHDLGMPDAVFFIDIKHTELSATGADQVTFMFSANKKMQPQPITKVASGGELSRLMLAIKYIISKSKTLPTIIFDEIDTGVSGKIADKMGNLIKRLSENIQVINITHLPQIAAKADTHLLVYKQSTPEGTITNIKQLNNKERIMEIAKMLSGEKITDSAIEHAKFLIENATIH